MSTHLITLTIPLAHAIESPGNGSQGETRGARFARAAARADLRRATFLAATTHPAWRGEIARWETRGGKRPRAVPLLHAGSWLTGPLTITLTRIAPGNGGAGKLDDHDGLPPAFKGPVDAIADALGLRADRDPRVSWRYAQRTGAPAIEVRVEPRPHCTSCGRPAEPTWKGCPWCVRPIEGAA